MKNKTRAIRILILILSISFLLPMSGFGAQKLNLEKSYPEDGFKNSEPVNMNVKLWFNKDVLDPSVQEINNDAFTITTTSGEAVGFDVLYNHNKGHISLLLTETLESNTEYVVTILSSLTATDNTTLGKDQSLTFKTRDVNAGNISSMIMMAVMVAIMVGATVISTKKQAENPKDEGKVNPYKVAKEKNTTVEKVIKDTQKAKDKSSQKTAGGKSKSAKSKSDKPTSKKDSDEIKKAPPQQKKTTAAGEDAPKATVNKGKSSSIKKLSKKQ